MASITDTQNSEPEFVSLLDLEQDTNEILGFNPAADANALIPPVPQGEYPVILTFMEQDAEKRWKPAIWGSGTANEQKVYYAVLTATVYNSGEFDGRQVRHQVSTFTTSRMETNSIQAVIQGIGAGEKIVSNSRGALCVLLNQLLEGNGAAGIAELDWEANEMLDDETAAAYKAKGKKPFKLQGMKRFPKDPTKEGAFMPVVNHEGVDCRARNFVRRFIVSKDAGEGVETAQGAPQPVAVGQMGQTSRQAPTHAQPAPAAAQGAPRAATATQGPPIPAAARGRAAGPVPATRK